MNQTTVNEWVESSTKCVSWDYKQLKIKWLFNNVETFLHIYSLISGNIQWGLQSWQINKNTWQDARSTKRIFTPYNLGFPRNITKNIKNSLVRRGSYKVGIIKQQLALLMQWLKMPWEFRSWVHVFSQLKKPEFRRSTPFIYIIRVKIELPVRVSTPTWINLALGWHWHLLKIHKRPKKGKDTPYTYNGVWSYTTSRT